VAVRRGEGLEPTVDDPVEVRAGIRLAPSYSSKPTCVGVAPTEQTVSPGGRRRRAGMRISITKQPPGLEVRRVLEAPHLLGRRVRFVIVLRTRTTEKLPFTVAVATSPIVTATRSAPGFRRVCSTLAKESSIPLTGTPARPSGSARRPFLSRTRRRPLPGALRQEARSQVGGGGSERRRPPGIEGGGDTVVEDDRRHRRPPGASGFHEQPLVVPQLAQT
jgi:hypothetical protein